MNIILSDIIKRRKGHYCHALEVDNVIYLQACIENLIDEFISFDYKKTDILEFINSLSIYCLNDINETEVYNFDINEYTNFLLGI